MHRMIIQIENCPILSDEELYNYEESFDEYEESFDEDDYPVGRIRTGSIMEEWFFCSVSDYVKEDKNHDETVDWFLKDLQELTPYVDISSEKDKQWIVFKEGFIHAYFSRIYPQFEEALANLVKNASIEALCGYEMEHLLYPLEKMNEDKFGVYIYTRETQLIPLNEFIRQIEPNKKYYIGGTLDYHL